MTRDVFILGSSTTPFRRWPERTHRDLVREAYTAALEDAGVDPARVEGAWFGSAGMHHFGQANIRGQVAMAPIAREGLYPKHAPIVNVEGGCATGALCLAAACHAVAAGACDVAVAVGVEKVFMPEAPEKMLALFNGGMDQLHPEEWRALYTELAPSSGTAYAPRADRSAILDAVALGAAWHMKTYGTTLEALARVASKNHGHGVHNPNAQYREAMSVDAVLADKAVVFPFTRAMCAPMSDGAAAVFVGSAEALTSARARIRVAGLGMANGGRSRFEDDSVTRVAARRAFARAGVDPCKIHIAEVHDSTAFAEIAALEDLGLCARGEGGPFTESGATALGGALPVNTSGGLESKGHPLAASGLAMVHELALQLTERAGARQVPGATWALAHNAGGLMGLDEATSVVTLLERRS
ncbi:MAG: thiolase family protein [Myxococcales bacterium]|nr:thiolase family protein [Myxococcales bacterium]